MLILILGWQAVHHASASQDNPSGRILFYGGETGNLEVYSIGADGGSAENLTAFPTAADAGPAWSPDGARIAFGSNRPQAGLGGFRVWLMNADGSNPQPLANGSFPSWSPDGDRLVYQCQTGICVIEANGANEQTIISSLEEGFYAPQWSPDGSRIAVTNVKPGGPAGIATFSAQGGDRVQLTADLGANPAWSPDGTRILYKTIDDKLAIVDVATRATAVVAPSVIARADWSPDGQFIAYGVWGNGLWIAKADGSNPVQITQLDAISPDWTTGTVVHSIEFTQAIQEWQSIPELQADLEGDGQPPVPLVAGKPTTVRIYFNELPEERTFIVDSNVSEFDVRTTQQAGCAPEDTRRDEDICSAADFTFEPPEGEWTAEIIIKDTSGETLEEYSFDFNTPKSPELVLVAVSICDTVENGSWLCGDEQQVVANARLLRRIAPTHEVRVVTTRHTISRQYDGGNTRAWWDAVMGDLRALVGRFPGDLVVPGERRMYVGAVRPEAPSGLAGLAEIGGVVTMAKTQTAALGRDDTQDTLAHEVGHALGAMHTNTGIPNTEVAPGCYETAVDGDTDWPYADNRLRSGPAPGDIEVGYSTFDYVVLPGDRVLEIMGYCGPSWISPRTSKVMLDGLSARLLGSDSVATPQGIADDFWLVSGRIDGGAATFKPLFEFAAESSTAAGEGAHRIEVRDGSDSVLFTRNFTPSESGARPEPGFDHYEAPPAFSEMIPVQPNAASIAIIGPGDALLGELELAGVSPAVAFVALPTPPVSGVHTISWFITDGDSAEHTSWLEYSPDNGATWNAIAVGLEMSSLQVDFDDLPGGANATLRVTVSDGVNTGSATSAPFAVTEKGPETTILNPTAGAVYAEGQAVSLEALAFDPDDGTLEDPGLTWSSSRDGNLGNGANVAAYGLSVGTHTITLTARDSDNNTATVSITVTVGEPVGDDRAWGDNDCDDTISSRDNQALSRFVLQQNPLSQTQPCPFLGATVTVTGTGPKAWGDLDCDGQITSRDGQALLRNILQQNPLSQTQPCPVLGDPVTASQAANLGRRSTFVQRWTLRNTR